jgi:DNA-binding IclR family transcriptional regulator
MPPRPSPQTDRVVAVTRLLAAHPEQGFTIAELARRLQLNKATLYPMLGALEATGWLVRDSLSKTYRLGPELLTIGEAAARAFPAASLARPAMHELSAQYGVSCAIWSGRDGHATLVDQVWDVRSTVPPMTVGQAIPIRAPFGAVFVAWADDEVVERWSAGSGSDFDAALAAIRDRGFAVELRTPSEERLRDAPVDAVLDPVRGTVAPNAVERLVDEMVGDADFLPGSLEPDRIYPVSTIGAPVFDADGAVVLCLTLLGFAGPLTSTSIDAIGGRLRREADAISTALARGSDRARQLS